MQWTVQNEYIFRNEGCVFDQGGDQFRSVWGVVSGWEQWSSVQFSSSMRWVYGYMHAGESRGEEFGKKCVMGGRGVGGGGRGLGGDLPGGAGLDGQWSLWILTGPGLSASSGVSTLLSSMILYRSSSRSLPLLLLYFLFLLFFSSPSFPVLSSCAAHWSASASFLLTSLLFPIQVSLICVLALFESDITSCSLAALPQGHLVTPGGSL